MKRRCDPERRIGKYIFIYTYTFRLRDYKSQLQSDQVTRVAEAYPCKVFSRCNAFLRTLYAWCDLARPT